LVRPVRDEARPVVRQQGRDAGLVLSGKVRPVVRQRFAAYAVVTSSRGLLATEYSGRTAVIGRWGMPGGGLDDHEPPTSAVLREVAEETSQEIILGELIKVQTSHWVGRSPYGTIEDFHAVRLVYRATCPHPTDPIVLDQGGTTESAQWVPLEFWRSVSWTQNWQLLLTELLDQF
jgi:ADP-ribose pyrophosphatase YjhB (NUDIX family)